MCLAPRHETVIWTTDNVAIVWQVKNLSGGELQRVAITLALGTPADIYLIDEPSAYLDSEQRIIAAKVIFRTLFPLTSCFNAELAAIQKSHL